MAETVILAHSDTDGVTAAAIVKAALGKGEVYFTHPIGLLEDFKNYARDAEIIVILDVSLDERNLPALFSEFRNRKGVIYIDHHPLPSGFRFEHPQLEVVHEENPCTAELAFRRFRLNWEMSRVALYGAIGDYSLNTRWVQNALNRWDIRTLFMEAGILILALDRIGRNYEVKRGLVDELSRNKLPSSIHGIVNLALEQSKTNEEMRKNLPDLVQTGEYLAYVINPPGSVGLAAFYAAVIKDKPIGLAVEERKGMYIGSLRSRDPRVDLNSLMRGLVPKFNGSGGGHRQAAGFRIPMENFNPFLSALEQAVHSAFNVNTSHSIEGT